MRRYLPALLLSLAAFGPVILVTGCDLSKLVKGEGADAGEAAQPVVVATDAAPAPAPAPTDAPPATAAATATTLPTATPTPGTPTATVTTRPVGTDAGAPVVIPDAGIAKDAGAVKLDAGVVPAPTFNIPHLLDAGNPFKGIDAGGFKLPTFPK